MALRHTGRSRVYLEPPYPHVAATFESSAASIMGSSDRPEPPVRVTWCRPVCPGESATPMFRRSSSPDRVFRPEQGRARLVSPLAWVAARTVDSTPRRRRRAPHDFEEYRMPSENTGGDGGVVDRLKGKAKQVAGSVLDDKDLEREGELHEEKADAAQEAKRRKAEAVQERDEADLVARERDLKIEEERLAAEETADARKAGAERDRGEEEQRIERDHAERKADAARHEQGRQAQITADEQRAARERAQARREASDVEDEAEQARSTAEMLDRATDKRGR